MLLRVVDDDNVQLKRPAMLCRPDDAADLVELMRSVSGLSVVD